MSELSHFVRLLKAPPGDRAILLIAFSLTVFVDITVAISVGMICASFLFMKRMSQMSKAVPLSQMFQDTPVDFPEKKDPDDISKKIVPPGVEVYEIQGPFFFGAANMLRDILSNLIVQPKVFILRMRAVSMIDASGMYGLEEFHDQCKKKGIMLLLSGVHGQTRHDLKNFGMIDAIGEQKFFPSIDTALASADKMIN